MANENKELIKKVAEHCEALMARELDPDIYQYHNISHVKGMKEIASVLADDYNLNEEDKANLVIACWFHDVGYGAGAQGHEERGAEEMKIFLSDLGLNSDRIDRIEKYILATKMDSVPNDMPSKIIKDADCYHVGTKEFFAKTGLLRTELETLNNGKLVEKEWLSQNLKFLHDHKFYTPIAEAKFNERKRKNILKVQKQLTSLLAYENNVVELDPEQKDLTANLSSNKADRGIETMFRVTLRNHNALSVIADNKANIMLSINSIMLSIVLSSLAPKLDTNPTLLIPTTVLTIVCVVSVILAVLATRPKISSAPYSDEAFMNKKFNMLFFGNFFQLPLEKFEWGLNTLMNNEDMLYSSLAKDLYFLGLVLAKKYKLLWYCYNVFAVGIVISVIAFIWAFSAMEAIPLPVDVVK
jgi:predicted metal-dependent HD superfamily phosphohydrolase